MKTNVWENIESAKQHLLSIAKNGFVPGYTEMERKYKKYFSARIKKLGNYKELVCSLGLKIKKHYQASDGHLLKSYYEYLFDEYLYLNNIPHDIDDYIISKSKCRYDFKINDVYIEIWGIHKNISEHFNDYSGRRIKKEKLYQKHNLKLMSIEGADFKLSSQELQTFFKNKLAEFNIHSQDNRPEYPIFNRKKLDYWSEETVIEELKNIIKTTNKFPTFKDLYKMKRCDLQGAIKNFGGYRKFAIMLGFEPKTKTYSEKRVIKEIEEIKKQLGHFPCDRELQAMKRSDLAGSIKKNGGYGFFKEKIEGSRTKRPYGYWGKEENIIKELQILCDSLGYFPSYQELGHIAKGIDKSKKGMRYFENKIKNKDT